MQQLKIMIITREIGLICQWKQLKPRNSLNFCSVCNLNLRFIWGAVSLEKVN